MNFLGLKHYHYRFYKCSNSVLLIFDRPETPSEEFINNHTQTADLQNNITPIDFCKDWISLIPKSSLIRMECTQVLNGGTIRLPGVCTACTQLFCKPQNSSQSESQIPRNTMWRKLQTY